MTTESKTAQRSTLWRWFNITLPYNKAKALYALGKTEAAFKTLCLIKTLKQPMEGVDLLRAKCRLKQDRKIEAFEIVKEELRLFPESAAALQFKKDLNYQPGDEEVTDDADYKTFLAIMRPYTMVGEKRLYSLYSLAKKVCEDDLPGNFAECGVAGGGTSALLAGVIAKYSKRPRKLYAFDTFDGLPAPKAVDAHAGVTAEEAGWGEGTCAAPITSLQKVCKEMQVTDIVVPVPGFFADTLPVTKEKMGPIALLHLDGDWYDSTRDILVNLYDQVIPGGAMQIDDYGFWEGCRDAVHDYEKEHNLKFKLNVVDFSGVWMTKEENAAKASV
ncbi:MAG: TylF/MycF/NovP-related O-methyltransferase [Candidatus Methylacidiphilales bacterium]|nr:TylF/MycF/NovP-related O-methyltransferase [Candidatus Methylacidiphilales bacterium]